LQTAGPGTATEVQSHALATYVAVFVHGARFAREFQSMG
jgi:hypothetical protein